MSLQLNTALVIMPEKEQIKLQTNDSFLSDEKRMYTFYQKQDKKEPTEITIQIAENVFKGAAEGALGGFVGGALVSGPSLGVIGSIFGGLPGFVAGYKIGVALSTAGEIVEGGLRGYKKFKIKFMSSDAYKTWTAEARKTDVYPVYRKIIEEDKRFEEYLCPLTCDLISLPVCAPDKRIYENESITVWIKQKQEQIQIAINSEAAPEKIQELREGLSPIRAKVNSFTVEDLRYYPEYFTGLDKLAKTKISEMEHEEEKRIFIEAMKAINSSHVQDRKQIIKLQIAEITMYVVNNDLDLNISKNVCRKLMEEIKVLEKREKENLV
jgi:uncharacterized protein YcfJ